MVIRTCVVIAGIVAVPLLPGFAAGQRMGGEVSARDTGRPIVGALVQLVAQDSTVTSSVLTDDSGRFVFPTEGCGPRNGYLSVVRLGYRAFRAAILDLPQDCSAWSITLETDAVRLPEVTVQVSRNRDLERVGFYARQRIADGRYAEPQNLATLNSEHSDSDIFVDPNERYVIFHRSVEATRDIELWIAFRNGGRWCHPDYWMRSMARAGNCRPRFRPKAVTSSSTGAVSFTRSTFLRWFDQLSGVCSRTSAAASRQSRTTIPDPRSSIPFSPPAQ